MAKAVYVKKAQKTLYKRGKRVEYVSERGKRAGQTLTKIDKSIPEDEKDEVFVEKGQPYWWWQFMNGGKNYSLTQPRRSQLTQSNYLSQLYEIEERISLFDSAEPGDYESFRDNVVDDLTTLKDECEESLSNMPEHLQESSNAGNLLTERIEALDNAISEFESLDLDFDLDEDLTEEEQAELIDNFVTEKQEEFQQISLEG